MKPVGLISAGVLLLILGAAAPTYARQDQHEGDAKAPKQEEAKPAKQQEQPKTTKQEEAKPQQAKPEEAKAPRQEEQAKPEKQQEAKALKQEEQAKPEKQQEAKVQQEQAKNSREPQRSAAAEQKQRSEPSLRLSVRGEGRIPDDRFHSNFGREHAFRIGSPRMVGGYSRFQYGGYWFGFVDPWPVGWYYTDDVYVDYVDGGYYLYNPYYPDTHISIDVVL